MFQTVVKDSCTVVLGKELPDGKDAVVPNDKVSQFLGIPPRTAHIYFRVKWEPGCFSIGGQNNPPNELMDDIVKKESEEYSFEDSLATADYVPRPVKTESSPEKKSPEGPEVTEILNYLSISKRPSLWRFCSSVNRF